MIDNATFIHVQKQSAVINMKENDANDTAVLSTIKNNVNSANNAASTYVQKQIRKSKIKSTIITLKLSFNSTSITEW